MRSSPWIGVLALAVVGGATAAFWSDGNPAAAARSPKPASAPAEAPGVVARGGPQLPVGHPPVAGGADNMQGSAGTADAPLQGVVSEVLSVERYTYLHVTRAAGEAFWAAVPTADVAVGDRVALADASRMDDFDSPSLNRRFETVYFGTLDLATGGEPAGAAGPAHGQASAKVAIGAIPATGTTIADVAKRREGDHVRLAAQAVKVTPNVLDRNWVHVQDGSGDASAGTHDLLITTTASVNVGDVVFIEGTVRRNKDLGSGYRYELLIEDAQIEAHGG